MEFRDYERLTAKQKATYRKSDDVTAVAIPDTPALTLLEAALTSGKRPATAKAAIALRGAETRA
jgi:hypothetical protein